MKLWLTSDNVDWDTGRYHYAVEQMMLTLFPLERPEYPDAPPPTSLEGERNAAVFTLHRGKKLTNVSALVFRENGWYNGVVRFPSEALDDTPEEAYRTVQRAVKQAFYKAGTALLGKGFAEWGHRRAGGERIEGYLPCLPHPPKAGHGLRRGECAGHPKSERG